MEMSKSIAQQREQELNPSPSPERLSTVKSANLTADGTEQTLLEFADVGRVMGYIDLGNMVEGDNVIIKQYMQVIEGGEHRPYADELYSGTQSPPLLYITPKETDFKIKITLQQTSGKYKVYPYNFMRE